MQGVYTGPGIGLQPLLAPRLRLLVVGFNPSIPAYRLGHYYANPTNRFYHLLHASGLTPHLLRPEEDADLPGYGIGVTDLCSVPSARAHDLTLGDFARGIARLRDTVRQCTPRLLCCNGVGVFHALFGHRPARIGVQPDLRLEGTAVCVVPSSSGAAGAFAAQRLAGWREAATFLAEQGLEGWTASD
jgi:TDG/mug DNA glycosylase family protein